MRRRHHHMRHKILVYAQFSSIIFALCIGASSPYAQQVIVVPQFVGGVDKSMVAESRSDYERAANDCSKQISANLAKDCLLAFMKKHGANSQAMAYVRLAPLLSVITDVQVFGVVSLVSADIIPVGFVEGGGGALIGKSGDTVPFWFLNKLSNDRIFQSYVARHPGMSLWFSGLIRHEALASGGDRVIFGFNFQDSPSGPYQASGHVAYDFDGSGRFAGAHILDTACAGIVGQPNIPNYRPDWCL